MSAPVVIVEYDPEWPVLYDAEKHRILRAVGDRVGAVEHIGSTSVSGLCGKPIIDIMAAVAGPEEADALLPALDAIGYDDVTKIEGDAEWFYCLGRGRRSLYYHLHLVRAGSDHWKRHILFRDYLKEHPETADEYCRLKKSLAMRYRTERERYTESKTRFIIDVVAKALDSEENRARR